MSGNGPGFTTLFRHELRLWWRSFSKSNSQTLSNGKFALYAALILLLLHGLALAFVRIVLREPVAETPPMLIGITGALALLWCWMLSQALSLTAQAMFARGDADLLLTAPMSMRKILTIRAFALSVPVIFSWGFIILPLMNVMAMLDDWHWLLAYPVMICLGLAATGLGLLITIELFQAIGPARTRTVAQILSVIVGALAFIVLQARVLLPESWVTALSRAFDRIGDPSTFDLSAPQWLAARALFGEFTALLLLMASTLALFTIAVWVFGGSYATQMAALAGASQRAKPKNFIQKPAKAFRTGANISLLRKEWRLLIRDPWLISHVLLQLLYILPMGVLFWRTTTYEGNSSAGIAPMLVMLSAQLAGGLAWITISGEDAPDLVAAAPVSRFIVLRAKITAALLPVAAITALPLLALTLQSLWVGAVAVLAALGASVCSICASLWMQKPKPRRTFGYRQKGSVLANLTEMALNFCWFLMSAALIWQSAWGFVPAIGLCVIMVTIYRHHKYGAPSTAQT